VLHDSESESLFDYARALLQRGVESAIVGPAALALALEAPLPAGEPWTVAVRHADLAAARSVAADDRVQLQSLATGASADAGLSWLDALRAHLEQEPVQAWGLAIVHGTVVDPFGALADAAQGRLRLRGDVRAFLRADAGNALQLAAWVARSGLRPTTEALRIAQRDAANVLQVDRAVWCERFGAVLLGEHAGAGLQFLFDAGVLQLMVPEVCAMVGFHETCAVHHKDIWDHTLQVVEKCPFSLVVRWAALMHDAGKVWTRSVGKQGRVHFFRHEEMGASLMEGVAGRFHMDAELRDRVVYIIANHARANVYATDWTDSAVRRLIRDMGPHLTDVLAFSQSDFTTKRAWRIAEVRSLAQELNERIPRIAAEDARVPPLPKGLGTVIMSTTRLGPGPWLGEVVRWLEAEVQAGHIAPQLQAQAYLRHVQAKAPALLAVEPGAEQRRVPRV